jgi:hypothetical protein
VFRVAIICLLICAAPTGSWGAAAKIKKVLTFYLDLEGRQSLSPSLFDRDAYQAELRNHPSKRSGLRFDVQWKASTSAPLKLRVEMRGAKGVESTKAIVETTVRKRGLFSRWARLPLTGEEYQKFGEVVAWRATLWEGDVMVGEEKSFLW